MFSGYEPRIHTCLCVFDLCAESITPWEWKQYNIIFTTVAQNVSRIFVRCITISCKALANSEQTSERNMQSRFIDLQRVLYNLVSLIIET